MVYVVLRSLRMVYVVWKSLRKVYVEWRSLGKVSPSWPSTYDWLDSRRLPGLSALVWFGLVRHACKVCKDIL